MSTICDFAQMRRTATSLQQAINIFLQFRSPWRKGRGHRRVQASRCALSDRELMDIGVTRGEIDDVASQRSIAGPRRSTPRHFGDALVILLLVNLFSLISVDRIEAQCTAQDVLRRQLAVKVDPPAPRSQIPLSSAADVLAWKTIRIGTFTDPFALRRAMSAIGCGVGNSADEILARPAFTLSRKSAEVELVTVSVAELAFQDKASLRAIYLRALELGFALAPAEIAPQLRLQYLDQPIGEFLIIGMEPIVTWAGEPVVLTVANGGAGLILIGQDGREDAQISAISRFVFVRPGTSMAPEAAAMAR